MLPPFAADIAVAALIAAGQVDQLAFHIDRGMTNGLTRTELSGAFTHLAFYAGWPRAVSALPVALKAFETRDSGRDSGKASATLEIQR